MKKNLFLAAVLCIGLTALFNSCVKDTFTEQDAYNEQRKNAITQDSIAKSQMEFEAQLAQEQALLLDSLKKVGGVINYSVSVVDASASSWLPTDNMFGKGSKGVGGAVVTLAQHGRVFTVTTDASGIASFSDLRIGTTNVNVKMTGYTEVDFVVILPDITRSETTELMNEDGDVLTNFTNYYDVLRQGATMIPVFSLTDNLSTLSGVVTVESDLTNDAPEPAADIQVKAIIDVEDDDFYQTYLMSWTDDKGSSEESSSYDFYGYVMHIAFGSMVSTAVTGADGSYTMDVPSSPQGLPIKIRVDEFALNQTLLQGSINLTPVWGVQSIRTLFGWDMDYSDVPRKGYDDWGEYQSAYVEFSAPTGAAAPQPTSDASAYAVLTSSGIVSVNITNPGVAYTQPPYVEFGLGSAYNSVKAEGTAVLSNGMVEEVTITSPGSGYMPDDNPTISFYDGIIEQASFEPEFAFSILDIDITNYGSGYGSTPPAVTITGSGTGATAEVKMSADIKEINMTAMGSGYTQAPQVVVSDNFGAWEEAQAVMTTENPLFSIAYDGTNTQLWPASPAPTVTVNGDGAGATATVTLSTVGEVTGVVISNGGTGYTSAPEVTFSGGGGGFGAAGFASIGTGDVVSVTITDGGQGYTSAPTVTFTGGEGAGATATAEIGFPVASIALNQPGVGYTTGGVTGIDVTNGTLDVNYVNECVIKYNHSVREVDFDDTGWFFSAAPTITFNSRDGNGSGAAATAVIDWWIYDILVTNPGSGYKEDDDNDVLVKIDPPAGAGTQAEAEAVLYNGKLVSTQPWNHGEGYTAAPHAYMVDNDGGVAGPIKQAELTATVSNGHVTALTITDPGEGYDYSSAMDGDYSIVISTYQVGAEAEAEANPESGKIAYIAVTDPGEGYAIVPTVEINNDDSDGDANGFGSGATATAVVTDGRVTAIEVTNAGAGYYETPDVNITVASTVITATGQCEITDGRITDVIFDGKDYPNYYFTGGFGYEAPPTLTFYPSVPGVGSGAEGVAIVENGTVTDVIMTNEGSGYFGMNKPLRRNVEITPSWRVVTIGGKSFVRDIFMGTGQRTMEQ